jgi:hypothetical protein
MCPGKPAVGHRLAPPGRDQTRVDYNRLRRSLKTAQLLKCAIEGGADHRPRRRPRSPYLVHRCSGDTTLPVSARADRRPPPGSGRRALDPATLRFPLATRTRCGKPARQVAPRSASRAGAAARSLRLQSCLPTCLLPFSRSARSSLTSSRRARSRTKASRRASASALRSLRRSSACFTGGGSRWRPFCFPPASVQKG